MTRRDGELDSDKQDDFGKNDYAALLGFPPCVEELIGQGEDVNTQDGKYRYPILDAVEMGEVELSRLLLQKGANIDSRYANGDTAFFRVIKRGYWEIFKVPLAAKPALEFKNSERRMTAVEWAVWFNRPYFLETLFEAGACVPSPRVILNSSLHLAAQYDHVTTLKVLLSARANIDEQMSDNLTALHSAARGSEQIIDLLLEHGTMIDAQILDGRTDPFISSSRRDKARDRTKATWKGRQYVCRHGGRWSGKSSSQSGSSVEGHGEQPRRQIIRGVVSMSNTRLSHSSCNMGRIRRIGIGMVPAEDVAEDPAVKEILQRAREDCELCELSSGSEEGAEILPIPVRPSASASESASEAEFLVSNKPPIPARSHILTPSGLAPPSTSSDQIGFHDGRTSQATLESRSGRAAILHEKEPGLVTMKETKSRWVNEYRIGQEELYSAAETVLNELRGMTEHFTPFIGRVNKGELPDYCNVIRSPMDLGLIYRKLVNLRYRSKQEFVEDLNLLESNRLKYHANPEHPLRPHALFMRKETERLASRIPDRAVRDRAEVAAEERRLHHVGSDSDSADESHDEPIISSKARKVRGKEMRSYSSTSD
ncbi:MAG: hypothetical protein Q9184_007058 [Pyrenodesmia sp. 2 TL-2023]